MPTTAIACPACRAAIGVDPVVVAILVGSGGDVTVRCPRCGVEIDLSAFATAVADELRQPIDVHEASFTSNDVGATFDGTSHAAGHVH
jgi:hypothetical protein